MHFDLWAGFNFDCWFGLSCVLFWMVYVGGFWWLFSRFYFGFLDSGYWFSCLRLFGWFALIWCLCSRFSISKCCYNGVC